MSSDKLPDHYKALGVDKNADTAAIKSAHRKLVLKCHPDKVTDPTLKAQKQEEFHKIQQAYETLIDDDKRADYEAHLTLEKLRSENRARQPASSAPRYESRTRYASANYTTEERKPTARSYEEERLYEERTRSKYDTYDAFPKTNSSPRTREKESARPTHTTQDRTRSDRAKTRDKEVRKARSDRKFQDGSESSADEKYAFQTEYKRRSEHDEARKKSAEAMRKAEDRRSYEDNRYPGATSTSSHRKMSVQEEAARAYQHKYKGQVQAEMESQTRPSLGRTSSRDYYGESRSSRSKEVRPEIRRSSAARSSKDRPSSSGLDRDRGMPEIVEWSSKPAFKHSSSSPANIEIPRVVPQRSRTDYDHREHRRTENSPPPAFHRSATMPSVPTASSSRRKETRPSNLRETMTPERSSPERKAYPEVPAPQTTTRTRVYRYPDDMTKPRTVLVEPERHQRSPEPMYREPMSRPPIGANRPSESSTKYVPQAPVPPNSSKTRSSARHASPVRMPEERGRLYGEIGSDRRGRQSSFSPGRVSYTRRYGPEDIRWAPQSGGERGRDFKPSFSRTNTLPVY